MKLPHPFEKAKYVKANLDGTISLIDAQGKPLARLPLITAFELSPEAEGVGDGFGSGFGFGFGSGSGVGDGYGGGYGSGYGSDGAYGFSLGQGDGTGSGDK